MINATLVEQQRMFAHARPDCVLNVACQIVMSVPVWVGVGERRGGVLGRGCGGVLPG